MQRREASPINTRVMAPLGDVLHRGIIVEPQPDHPSGVISFITCPLTHVTVGWF